VCGSVVSVIVSVSTMLQESTLAQPPVLVQPAISIDVSSSSPETRTLWLLASLLSSRNYGMLPTRLRVRLLRVLIERALDTSLVRYVHTMSLQSFFRMASVTLPSMRICLAHL
jgi:hypothetical protein